MSLIWIQERNTQELQCQEISRIFPKVIFKVFLILNLINFTQRYFLENHDFQAKAGQCLFICINYQFSKICFYLSCFLTRPTFLHLFCMKQSTYPRLSPIPLLFAFVSFILEEVYY